MPPPVGHRVRGCLRVVRDEGRFWRERAYDRGEPSARCAGCGHTFEEHNT